MHFPSLKTTSWITALVFALFFLPSTNLSTQSIFSQSGQLESIIDRFDTPMDYQRMPVADSSFAYFLRHLPLYPSDRLVHLFNGQLKSNQGAHAAVIDIDVGASDLQQCADAIMRLRAEYLFKKKEFDEINFHFVSGFFASYKKWRDGHRIRVKGNDASWYQTDQESVSYASFRHYLNMVFSYAGTLSLEKELKSVAVSDIKIGDIFIQGGSPGHAVLVVDLAEHMHTRKKIFLLAQSYMPAQDIHILVNPNNPDISPWYSVDDIGHGLITPEWEFPRNSLRRFQ